MLYSATPISTSIPSASTYFIDLNKQLESTVGKERASPLVGKEMIMLLVGREETP